MNAPASHAAHKTMRLFTALWPDAGTRDAIAAWQHAWEWPPRTALVKRERLHITLHFLGDVPAHRLPQFISGLQVAFEPFVLELGQGEVWPRGLAVLRPQRTPSALARLHASLGDALTGLGLSPEMRPFRAHVTLARRAAGAVTPPRGPGLRWDVNGGYTLMHSLPGEGGYEVIERFR